MYIAEDINKKETEINIQMEKIYAMVAKKEALAKIKIEYDKYVNNLAELYTIFFEKLNQQKKEKFIDEQEWAKQKDYLSKKYKEELILLAVAVDDALGLK